MLLQSMHKSEFVLRGHSCVDPDILCNFLEFSLIHLIKLSTGNNPRSFFKDPQFLSDGAGSPRIITCDHDRSDACFLRYLYRLYNLRTDRVNHAHEPHENQLVFYVVRTQL